MQFVLHKSVKGLRRFTVLIVVVTALFKDVRNFLISPTLAGADLADALEQLVEVVLAKGTAALQHVVVEDEALLNKLLQGLGRPLAKPVAFLAFSR